MKENIKEKQSVTVLEDVQEFWCCSKSHSKIVQVIYSSVKTVARTFWRTDVTDRAPTPAMAFTYCQLFYKVLSCLTKILKMLYSSPERAWYATSDIFTKFIPWEQARCLNMLVTCGINRSAALIMFWGSVTMNFQGQGHNKGKNQPTTTWPTMLIPREPESRVFTLVRE